MTDPNIEMLRRKLDDSSSGGVDLDAAFSQLEAKILLLVDTIESAHEARLEEMRQEAARLSAARSGSGY